VVFPVLPILVVFPVLPILVVFPVLPILVVFPVLPILVVFPCSPSVLPVLPVFPVLSTGSQASPGLGVVHCRNSLLKLISSAGYSVLNRVMQLELLSALEQVSSHAFNG
jgi:hypothetical protein